MLMRAMFAAWAFACLISTADCAPPQGLIPTSHPRSTLEYTINNWLSWKTGIDEAIEQERSGRLSDGGFTWPQFWGRIISSLSEYNSSGAYVTGHPNIYIDYIVEHRRAASLPELQNVPNLPEKPKIR
jgi:hypothetical protein